MATPAPDGYKTQTISKRYIKNIVLENYVNAKLDVFGASWSYEVPRDNKIKFIALQELSEAEVKKIQKDSYPDRNEDDFE